LQDFVELNKEIIEEISTKLNSVNDQSRNFIRDIVILIKREIGLNNVISIILFGSQILTKENRDISKVSDCDLLIVFKDNVPQISLKRLNKFLITTEIKHKFRDSKVNLGDKILKIIQQSTGMFISHFLTKRKYFELGIFHKIFQVNELFSKIFAPTKIVLSSVIDNSEKLYGLDLKDLIKKEIKVPPFDMIKSIIMNLLISLFALVISPFKMFNSMKFQLEAIKWSLRASNYYSFRDSKTLETLIKRFKMLEKSERFKRRADSFYERFIELRKNTQMDIDFMLRCPLRVIRIHIKGLIFKKILKKINRRKGNLKIKKK